MDAHYTICPGDSLNSIAQRFNVDREDLYEINSGTLLAAAQAHGKQSSEYGTNIYPGTTIRIVRTGILPHYGKDNHGA